MKKAQANEYGVTWAPSKTGQLQIAVGADKEGVIRGGIRFVEVWALYAGTHDIAPGTRRFTGPDRVTDARDYANQLWRNR